MTRTARPDEINGGYVDRYTVVHVCSGILIRGLGKKKIGWLAALGLAVGWEFLEHPMKDAWPGVFAPYDTQDSFPNSFVDVVAVMLGYGLMSLLDAKDGAWI